MTLDVLDVNFDAKYYNADAIQHGRVARKFVETLCKGFFDKAFDSYNRQRTFKITPELYLLYKERNLYSLLAASLDQITPVHMSEWAFNKSDTGKKSRRVDFWCLNKDGVDGKALNYFIELKKNNYCVSKGTARTLSASSKRAVTEIKEQIAELKKIKPEWGCDGNVYIGMIVTHGFRPNNKMAGYDSSTLRDEINKSLDKRIGAQLLFATWNLPESLKIQWENRRCDFVAISTIVVTKQRKNGIEGR